VLVTAQRIQVIGEPNGKNPALSDATVFAVLLLRPDFSRDLFATSGKS
jgi:hypothetical protein